MFYVGGFVSAVDPSRPCVLSITVDGEIPDGTQYLLWIDSIEASYDRRQVSALGYLLVILGGAIGGFVLTFVFYRLSLRRKQRMVNKIWEEGGRYVTDSSQL